MSVAANDEIVRLYMEGRDMEQSIAKRLEQRRHVHKLLQGICGAGSIEFSEVDADGSLIFHWDHDARWEPIWVLVNLHTKSLTTSSMDEPLPLPRGAVGVVRKALTPRMLKYLRSLA
tara:strand:+ start:1409 stop:1759 length:351 start_codon:yes stop_codon:yes gene_type:complete